ncbi:hypothetical protein [Marinilactibacillus piezotolerans]|uniref:hypothetical protein n=1 Tax=Marinilactibacillus piezotolerans TaxID=258723 RepID=UPI0009B01D2B|nr:hypothetical protein [Marinilactibacillus piezotolerans]
MFYFLSVFFAVAYKYILVNEKISLTYAIFSLGMFIFFFLIDFYILQKKGKMLSVEKWSVKTLIVVVVSFILTGISKDTTFIMPVIFAIMFAYRHPSLFFKSIFFSSTICFSIHFLFYFTGFLESHDLIRIYSTGDVGIRHSLGFTHPNAVFMFFLPIFFSVHFYLRNTKYHILVEFLFLIIGCWLFFLTNSRTAFILLVMFYFLNLKFFKKKVLQFLSFNAFRKVVKYSFFIFLTLSVVIAVIGTDPNSAINRLLSGRPYLFNLYLNNQIKLINIQGVSVIDPYLVPGQYDATLDNIYIFSITQHGILPTILISFLFVKMFNHLINTRNTMLLITSFIFLVYGFMETNAIVPSLNFTLPFLVISYFNKNYFSNLKVGSDEKNSSFS